MRIVGLDLGTSSIKLVEIDSAFGRYEIHDHREIEVIPGQDPSAVAGEVLKILPQSPHRLVVSLRSSQLTTRNLQLPTRDKKAIASAVQFELEDELPFSIENSAIASVILAQVGQQSQIHVAATLKKVFISELNKLSGSEIDPDVVTSDAWALRTLLNRTVPPSEQEKPILVIHLGERSTLFYIHWRGFPMLGREIQWGGQNFAQALSSRLNVDLAQSSRLLKNPSLLSDSHPEGALALLSEPLEALHRELRHMDLVCKAICHEPVNQVLLSGGASLIPGLTDWLESSTRLSVQRLRALSSLSPSGVSYSEVSDARMAIAAGLAMSQVGADRSSCLNFRKGEFSKTAKGAQFALSQLRTPLIGATVAAAAFFVSMTVQNKIYSKQLEEKDAQLRKSMSAFFGSVSQSALRTYLSSPQSLKNSIQKELDKNRELARIFGPNPKSPLNYLKSLSEAIPRDATVDTLRFQLGAAPDLGFDPRKDTPLTLTLMVSDPKSAERLSQLLIPKLITPESAAAKPTTEELPAQGGKPKRYRLTWTGKAVHPAAGG
ncbi:MAG: pilus assembly protein PilM [Oligoflexia bacterium]